MSLEAKSTSKVKKCFAFDIQGSAWWRSSMNWKELDQTPELHRIPRKVKMRFRIFVHICEGNNAQWRKQATAITQHNLAQYGLTSWTTGHAFWHFFFKNKSSQKNYLDSWSPSFRAEENSLIARAVMMRSTVHVSLTGPHLEHLRIKNEPRTSRIVETCWWGAKHF